MALQELIGRADTIFQALAAYLNPIIIALVIILLGFIIGKIVERILRKVLHNLDVDDHLKGLFNAKRHYERAIRRTVVRLIYLAAVYLALDRLSLSRPVIIILLALVIIVLLVSGVLAGLDVVPNIIAWVRINKRFRIGDTITTKEYNGTIADITMTEVRVKRKSGELLFVPNAAFLTQQVKRKKREE